MCGSGCFSQLRIKFRIIVHFELEVDAEAASALLNFGQQVAECDCEVLNLSADDIQSGAAAFAMFGSRVESQSFFVHVIFLEREDGQAIDHHTGRFGIEGAAGFAWLQCLYEVFIDLFDEVIAALVVPIDGAFCLADAFGSEVIAACDILFVPE